MVNHHDNDDQNEKRSHRYDINSFRSKHGYKYSKYIRRLSMMMILISIKQHLSNIWSWIHEKVKQHWGWVEKKVLPIKTPVYNLHIHKSSEISNEQYPKVNLMFLYTCFIKLFVTFVSSNQFYLQSKCPQNCLSWL